MWNILALPGSSVFRKMAYKTSAALDWEGRSNTVAGKVTRLDYSRFVYEGPCENYMFPAHSQSLHDVEVSIKQSIGAVSTKSLEKLRKSMNFGINHIIRVNGGHKKQHTSHELNFSSTSIIIHIGKQKMSPSIFLQFLHHSKTFWTTCKIQAKNHFSSPWARTYHCPVF